MWYFMYLCYGMTLLTYVLLLLNIAQNLFHFSILNANHFSFGLITIIVYLFTQTLIIFYFVGLGVSIRDYSKEKTLAGSYHQRSLKVKRALYPPLLLNILIFMGYYIAKGAIHIGQMPSWLGYVLFFSGLIHFGKVIRLEHAAFRESTYIVLDMAGMKHPQTVQN